MVAITINVDPETLERARMLAERDGRRVDEVVSELATEAIVNEERLASLGSLHPEWRAEIAHRLATIDDGTETFKPAAQAIADIRSRFGW
jgi:DNA-directed RNA polymerase subunit F